MPGVELQGHVVTLSHFEELANSFLKHLYRVTFPPAGQVASSNLKINVLSSQEGRTLDITGFAVLIMNYFLIPINLSVSLAE